MGKPFVLTVHDTSIFDFPEDHPFEWREYIRAFLGRRARAAARVITGTEHSRRDIIQDLGVPAERIAVTPYGVAMRFHRVTPQSSPPSGRESETPQLLFPGAPSRRKNLELVLVGMAEAPPDSVLRRANLAISGADRDAFPTYGDRVKALGLESRVRWKGKVTLEEMPGLMEASDAVVYPSLQEGFGFPALEAMSLGTPVIASNTSCLPEVLGDGALLIDPTDVKGFIAAAEAVLTRPHVRQELIVKGRARASHFTWERCADLTLDVYREALRSAGRISGGSR
jgi:glycosyltransferase involved in cell wall biosynthesis